LKRGQEGPKGAPPGESGWREKLKKGGGEKIYKRIQEGREVEGKRKKKPVSGATTPREKKKKNTTNKPQKQKKKKEKKKKKRKKRKKKKNSPKGEGEQACGSLVWQNVSPPQRGISKGRLTGSLLEDRNVPKESPGIQRCVE